jgi:hypothetical protein
MAQDVGSLPAQYAAVQQQLANSPFHRPLYLVSSEQSGKVSGDIYALITQPYVTVGPALQGMNHWCDILILHLNVKSCRSSTAPGVDTLSLTIGRKYDRPLPDVYQFEFHYQQARFQPNRLQAVLQSAAGPLGTSNYRIMLEAMRVDADHSFLHLSYSYTNSLSARLAMRTYLATLGHDKVGFSMVGRQADGQPVYIGGLRGVIERNTMRYYLAVEAYLSALPLPAQDQFEQRLNDWFASTERYPRQLHEQERDEYLAAKHGEMARQSAAH